MEYYPAIKKNEIMPYAATWMGLEIVIHSKSGREEIYDIPYESESMIAQWCPTLWPTDCSSPGLLCPWNSLGKNTGVDCPSLLQGIFLAHGLNLGRLHCRQILYHLSHKGSLTSVIGKKLKEIITNELTYKTERDRLRPWTYDCQGGKWGEGIVREFGIDMYTLLHLKWIANKDLLYGIGNAVQCYVAAWMRGEFGGERIHIYVWLSSFTVHLKLSQHY